jgi:hypothetical protein
MGIFKKFNEFLESPKMETEFSGDYATKSPDELKDALAKLAEEGGEVEWNQYKITLPSELNGEGQSKTYLVDKGGKHAQAQSEEDVEKIVTEQVLFESFRGNRKRK